MQPSSSLWVTLCEDLQKERMRSRREEYVRVALDFAKSAESMLRPGSPRLADAREIAGDICLEAGAPSEAESCLRSALQVAEASASPAQIGRIAGKLAELVLESGSAKEAESLFQLAIRSFDAADDHSSHGVLFGGLANARRRRGDFRGAEAAYRNGIEILKSLHGPEHADLAVLNNNLGVLLTEAGDYQGAEAAHLQALSLRETIFGTNHPEVAHSMANLGVVNHLRGTPASASKYYQAALEIYRHFSNPEAEEVKAIESYLLRLSEG